MAADEAAMVEVANPDDAAVEKSCSGAAPPKGPCICHAQLGEGTNATLFSIALPC